MELLKTSSNDFITIHFANEKFCKYSLISSISILSYIYYLFTKGAIKEQNEIEKAIPNLSLHKNSGNKIRPVIHLGIQQPKSRGIDCHRTNQKGRHADNRKVDIQKPTRLFRAGNPYRKPGYHRHQTKGYPYPRQIPEPAGVV